MSKLFRAALAFACALAFAGCAKNADNSGGRAAGGGKRLAFVTNNAADFWTIARRGVEKADAELPDVTAEFRIPDDGTAATQKRIIDDLLAKGVDAIAVSPVDPENQTQLINDAVRQNVLVFTQDSDAPKSERACYIGTDNVAAGRQAGGLIREALPDGGRIMVFVGNLDARNATERLQGIKEALAGSNVTIIDTRTDGTEPARAKANAADTLVSYPDVAALVGLWSYNGPAIVSAVRDAGKVGQVKIIAFDEQDETLAGVKDGSIYGTVVQQPYEFGYQAIRMMAQVLAGDRSGIPPTRQKFIETQVIKRDNVEEFTRKINQLRGRAEKQ